MSFNMFAHQGIDNFVLCGATGSIKSVYTLIASVGYVARRLSGGGYIALLFVGELDIVKRLRGWLLNYAYIVVKPLSLNKVKLNSALMIVLWLIGKRNSKQGNKSKLVRFAVSLLGKVVGSIAPTYV